MAKRTGPSNEYLIQLISELKKVAATQKAGVWSRIAEDLSKPTRSRRAVNTSRINRTTAADETIIVPGKVLGAGPGDHSITVAAFSFSAGARQRIQEAKGRLPLGIEPMMGPISTGLGEIFMWTVDAQKGAKKPDDNVVDADFKVEDEKK